MLLFFPIARLAISSCFYLFNIDYIQLILFGTRIQLNSGDKTTSENENTSLFGMELETLVLYRGNTANRSSYLQTFTQLTVPCNNIIYHISKML